MRKPVTQAEYDARRWHMVERMYEAGKLQEVVGAAIIDGVSIREVIDAFVAQPRKKISGWLKPIPSSDQ